MREISVLTPKLFFQTTHPLMKIPKLQSRLELKWKNDFIDLFWVNQKNKITIRKVSSGEEKEIILDSTDKLELLTNSLQITSNYLCFIASSRRNRYLCIIDLYNYTTTMIECKYEVLDYLVFDRSKVIVFMINNKECKIIYKIYDINLRKILYMQQLMNEPEFINIIGYSICSINNRVICAFIIDLQTKIQITLVQIYNNNSIVKSTIIDDDIEFCRNFCIDILKDYIIFIIDDRLCIFDHKLNCLLDKSFNGYVILLCRDTESPMVVVGLCSYESIIKLCVIDPKTGNVVFEDELNEMMEECYWIDNKWLYISSDNVIKCVDRNGSVEVIGRIESHLIRYGYINNGNIIFYNKSKIFFIDLEHKQIYEIPVYGSIKNVNGCSDYIIVKVLSNHHYEYHKIERIHRV